ncbi:MAG: Wzy polymerase domain-containing protein [Pseudomonadota bacterium]
MKKTFYSDISLAPLWCLGAAFLLSLGWLLPNSARPWTTFHSDAWVACVLIVISLVVLCRSGSTVRVPVIALVVIATSLLPLIQYYTGTLPFSGQAWISTGYLLALALAIITGHQWQRLSPLWMERILFVAFLFAGMVSAFLAMYQWLRFGESAGMTDIWVLPYPAERGRPYANLGQPNQLATLLLWALLACAWAAYRGYLRVAGAVSVAAFLLIGLALTQSRSAMLGVLFGLVACWVWRRRFTARVFTRCVLGLTAWYVLLLATLPGLGQMLLLETEISFVERSTKESRPYMWRMVLDAATQRPWTGYGWNQVMPAQLAVSEAYTGMSGRYLGQSHNLLLDFIVWAGFPLGLLFSGVVLVWLWLSWKRVSSPIQALYFTLVAVTCIHAMVEFPLHYAYFLLPVGLILGALSGNMSGWKWVTFSRRYVLGLWLMLATLLGLLIKDYFGLESAYNDIRFEKANFVDAPKQHIPETLVLNHLQYVVELYGVDPAPGFSAERVQRFVDTTTFLPSAYNISKLIVILALNKQPEAARFWMHKAKSMMSPENYANAQKDWVRASKLFPQIAATLQVQP